MTGVSVDTSGEATCRHWCWSDHCSVSCTHCCLKALRQLMFYSSGLNQYDNDESHCIIKENQTHWYTSARVCEILTQRYIH